MFHHFFYEYPVLTSLKHMIVGGAKLQNFPHTNAFLLRTRDFKNSKKLNIIFELFIIEFFYKALQFF